MAAKQDNSSELTQIVLLTLAMTGGGLLLLFLVLHFFMVPGVRAEVSSEAKRYEDLVRLLQSDEMNVLRRDVERRKGSEGEKQPLLTVVSRHRQANGIRSSDMPAKIDPRSGSETRRFDLEPCGMDQIFRFVIGVSEAKRTIELEKLDIRASRSRSEEQLYTANVTFVDYAAAR
ncbi:MAG: hypothetical protein O7J95_07640 [Planctomycetota bacterium]|nr:hypothetical protein [Planctomycetota bacterium]